ncbi:MAG: hypothetical protein O3A45_04225 [Proteobacteria bacterium]|nr:hypothetical protein [Pseudomonadota bacterium]
MSNSSNREPLSQGFKDSGGSPWYLHEVTGRSGLIDTETGEISVLDQQQAAKDARRERYKLLDVSAKILRSFHGKETPINAHGHEVTHRTCKCNRVPLSPTTQILKSEQQRKAFFGGVMQCASVWTCPVCAAKINERKANEMRVAFNQAPELGLKAHLVTFTAPHTAGDTIDDLSRKMRDSLASFWAERRVKNWKKSRGVAGNIRAFEVRYGENGWHPHFHLIVFSKDSIALDKDLLLDKWQTVCLRNGLDQPNEYGLDIQDGSKAGEYICKFGSDGEVLERADGKKVNWDAADEMTKGNVKKGKSGSLGPWDILRVVEESESEEERRKHHGLFLHYARAMKGVSQLKWSRGLRKVFDLEAEKSDEEILAEQEDAAKLLCHLSREEWRHLIQSKSRATVLELAENGGSEAVARYLYNSIHYKKYASVSGDWFLTFYQGFMSRQSEPPS